MAGIAQERREHPGVAESSLRRLVMDHLSSNPDYYRRRVEIGEPPPAPPAWQPGDVDPALPDAPDDQEDGNQDGPSKAKTGSVALACAGLFAVWMLARSRRQAAGATGSTT